MNKNKGFSTLSVLIIILVVVLVGGGVTYYYYTQKNSPKQVCAQEAKLCPDGSSVGRTGPNCEFALCPNSKIDETAGWETYTNQEYGFEIKYPSSLQVEEIYSGIAMPLSRSTDKNSNKGSMSIRKITEEKSEFSDARYKTAEECVFTSKKMSEDQMLTLKTTSQNINGAIFNYYVNYPEFIGAYCGMSGGCIYKDIYRTFYKRICYEATFERSDRTYNDQEGIRKYATEEELKVPKIFNQILATFKFIR